MFLQSKTHTHTNTPEKMSDDVTFFNYDDEDDEKWFAFQPSEFQYFYFRMIKVSHGIACLQFFQDSSFGKVIDVPEGFVLVDPRERHQTIRPFKQMLLFAWLNEYKLFYNNEEIFCAHPRKEQIIKITKNVHKI